VAQNWILPRRGFAVRLGVRSDELHESPTFICGSLEDGTGKIGDNRSQKCCSMGRCGGGAAPPYLTSTGARRACRARRTRSSICRMQFGGWLTRSRSFGQLGAFARFGGEHVLGPGVGLQELGIVPAGALEEALAFGGVLDVPGLTEELTGAFAVHGGSGWRLRL